MFQPLHFTRERRKPRVKVECFWAVHPAEAGPGITPELDSFGVYRGHRKKDTCLFVLIRNWRSYLIFHRPLSLSHRHSSLQSYLAKKSIASMGWCLLGGHRQLASLPSTLSLILSFGHLEMYFIQPPCIDRETDVWRVQSDLSACVVVS